VLPASSRTGTAASVQETDAALAEAEASAMPANPEQS